MKHHQAVWLLTVLMMSLSVPLHAQAPITQSGLNTRVSDPFLTAGGNTQFDITGGTRPGGGTNLFHSFGDFNVPTNNIANFLNDAGLPTSNVLGRVTGGNASIVYGMIQTNGPGGFGNANLFLMNPAGFLFGPNATVSVGGMVAFTTADYFGFQGTQTLFNNASTPESLSPLSIAPVAAFGFLGSNPAAIAIQGSTLTVAEGQSLSLVGGNKGFTGIDPDNGNPIHVPDGITMTGGKLVSPAGQINIASIAGAGEISAIDFLQTTGMTMGNISLSQGALVEVSADAAGMVRIRGAQLVIDNSTISSDTIDSDGASAAVDVNLTRDLLITADSQPALTARTTGTGNGGRIEIAAGNMQITTVPIDIIPIIDTHTSASGTAGDVTISLTGTLKSTGDPFAGGFFIDTGTLGADGGQGGNVTINAKHINLENGIISTGDFISGLIGEDAAGSAGKFTTNAETLRLNNSFIATDAQFAGVGGDQTISAATIEMTDLSSLSASGVEKGGKIHIISKQLLIDASQVEVSTVFAPGHIIITGEAVEFRNGSTAFTQTLGNGAAGDITITASEHLTLADNPSFDRAPDRPSGLYTNSIGILGTQGHSGSINLTTPLLEISGGARIDSTTRTTGGGGSITINANAITISGQRPFGVIEGQFGLGGLASGIYSRTIGSSFCSGPCGGAGHISITTSSLDMSNGATINSSTVTTGRGGDVTVQASETLSIGGTLVDGTPGGVFSQSTSTNPGAGAGGNILLTADQFATVSDGASVSASTSGPGNAGSILIKANDISIRGGGTITAASTGTGNAGTVTIEGPNSPANSFLIDGTGSGVFTNSEDTGVGGSISLDANTVTLQNGGTISASTSGSSSSATGGNISISAGQFVEMNTGASITASSTGLGNAGNILIDAGPQLVMQNSSFKTEAAKAGGGNIEIQAVDLVQLGNSTVSTSVLGGSGSGGNITIDPNLVLLQNSQIIAQAVQGAGGNISITTNLLMPDSTSLISASSQFGQQGNIVIQSPVSPASGKLVPLGQKPLIATSLLSQRCTAIAGGSISSFTVAGRDSLPTEPGGWLSSPVALSAPESEDGTVREANRTMSDETPLLSLRKIAPSGFLTQAFAVESSGCQS